MTVSAVGLLLTSMVILAVVPGPGIYVVVSRTLAYGLKTGSMTTLGIVLGDFVFIFLVYFGFSSLANEWAELFTSIVVLGGFYLIGLSIYMLFPVFKNELLDEKSKVLNHKKSRRSRLWLVDILSGLLVTLSNPKAILFYASFLPAFLDFNDLSLVDLCSILFCAALAVGSVMMGYAYLSYRARHYIITTSVNKLMQIISAILMASAGLVILLRYL